MASLLPADGLDGTAIAAGAVAGLISGCLGLLVLPTDTLSAIGAASGAVVGGATAGWLADGGLPSAVVCAVAADALSSVAFFVLVIGFLLPFDEGTLAIMAAVTLFVPFGVAIAAPVAVVSAAVAAVVGGLASLTERAVG